MNLKNKYELDQILTQIFDNNNKEKIDFLISSYSKDDTREIAIEFSRYLKQSDVLVLNGELGSGKTVFMSGIAKYFDIENQVSSPTFTIVNEYITKDDNAIYHFDVYRIKSVHEFINDVGTEYFCDGICIIEWGNIIKEVLPRNTIFIDISKDDNDENKRYFHIWRN